MWSLHCSFVQPRLCAKELKRQMQGCRPAKSQMPAEIKNPICLAKAMAGCVVT